MKENLRLIAINLPQFHPFKENDEWWGKGFTEWTNVVKARPRFFGHYQPHLPSDTGFYDLRLPEARQMQADMAKEYGIYGFCYYHYWFNGHRLMERPVNEILSSGEPDFPFMLCWANENWSRNWDGGFNKMLIEQKYTDEDDVNHMKYLCENVFSDKRYIKVDGKPVFMIYRPQLFPDMKHTIDTWRCIAREYGMELYLIFSEINGIDKDFFISCGFDASMNFQPTSDDGYTKKGNLLARISRKITKGKYVFSNFITSYKDYVEFRCSRPVCIGKSFPCACPNFDNSPRRVKTGFYAFKGSTPKLFGKWLKYIVENFIPFSKEENFVFLNAWNEWAEGNHLEPDQKWGRQYLEEVAKAIEKK